MRNAVLAVVAVVLSFGVANATVPNPDLCSVDPCDNLNGMIICPYTTVGIANAEFTVNVRNNDNLPIPGAFVEIEFLLPGNQWFCTNAVTTGMTDAAGNVTFNISAGGCVDGVEAVKVWANNVRLRTYNYVKSPDYDGATGDGDVGITDLSFFGVQFVNAAPGCTDYDNTGATGLTDLTTFGQGWAHHCP
jgi:hypothetical protein